MSELSSIRSMRDLEYQRSRLQLKADKQEQRIRRDIESIKADYAPIVNGVNSLRTGISKLRQSIGYIFDMPIWHHKLA